MRHLNNLAISVVVAIHCYTFPSLNELVVKSSWGVATGRNASMQKPAMIRSEARRLGARFAPTIEDPQLMFDEHRLGNDGTEASWPPCYPGYGDDQMNEKDDDIAHPGMLSNPKNT